MSGAHVAKNEEVCVDELDISAFVWSELEPGRQALEGQFLQEK